MDLSVKVETPHEISFKITLALSACELHICQELFWVHLYMLWSLEGGCALGPNASVRDFARVLSSRTDIDLFFANLIIIELWVKRYAIVAYN